jgi:flagellin
VKVDNNMTFSAPKGLGVNRSDKKESVEKNLGSGNNTEVEEIENSTILEEKRNWIIEQQKSNSSAQNAISLIQTAESALEDIHKKLQTSKELIFNESNKEHVSVDQTVIQSQIKKLYDDINSIVANTEFNSRKLLSGDESVELYAGSSNSVRISIPIGDMSTNGLGKGVIPGKSLSDINALDFESVSANQQIGIIDKSIEDVSTEKERLSAAKDKLEDTINSTQFENSEYKGTFIKNSAIAQEMVESYKSNVIYQASTTIKAQSNQSPLVVKQFLISEVSFY